MHVFLVLTPSLKDSWGVLGVLQNFNCNNSIVVFKITPYEELRSTIRVKKNEKQSKKDWWSSCMQLKTAIYVFEH